MTLTKIFATSGSRRAQGWLSRSKKCRILHHFDQVVNLVNERAEVLSVHVPAIPLGPLSLQLSEEEFRRLDWQGRLKVDAESCQLKVGHAVINNTDLTVWSATPEWQKFDPRLLKNICIDHKLNFDIIAWLDQLRQGLELKQRPIITEAARSLAGRGIGLTPAGDDVLIGVMYALWALNKPVWVDLIGQTAFPYTTTLSQNFIQCAMAGEAIQPWHDFIHGDVGATDSIAAIGHSSGKDSLTAFMSVFKQLS